MPRGTTVAADFASAPNRSFAIRISPGGENATHFRSHTQSASHHWQTGAAHTRDGSRKDDANARRGEKRTAWLLAQTLTTPRPRSAGSPQTGPWILRVQAGKFLHQLPAALVLGGGYHDLRFDILIAPG